ncbi:low affinity iron permease family protein [Kitasatospora sp. NPDC056138]|uniref:low affinity iron permease family protein n=1 Tax=Kitasatospora sp. NPDC056138 TaxID=3345724 RepID=UPI0035DF30A0
MKEQVRSSFRHPAESSGDRRSLFGHVAEAGSNFTSSPLFHAICVLLVVAFVVVHAVGVPLEWQLFVGDAMSAVTLLLPALLKNAERRSERAVQRKLDAIAAAMLEQQEGKAGKALQDLREASRMEEEL